jgi:hypothetical protein
MWVQRDKVGLTRFTASNFVSGTVAQVGWLASVEAVLKRYRCLRV